MKAEGSFLCTHDPVEVVRLPRIPVEGEGSGRPEILLRFLSRVFCLQPVENEVDLKFSIAAGAKGSARVIYPTVLATWAVVALSKMIFDLAGKGSSGFILAGTIALGSFLLFFHGLRDW